MVLLNFEYFMFRLASFGNIGFWCSGIVSKTCLARKDMIRSSNTSSSILTAISRKGIRTFSSLNKGSRYTITHSSTRRLSFHFLGVFITTNYSHLPGIDITLTETFHVIAVTWSPHHHLRLSYIRLRVN